MSTEMSRKEFSELLIMATYRDLEEGIASILHAPVSFIFMTNVHYLHNNF